MTAQSSNTLFMIEPSVFFLNPQTADTNHYQIDRHESHDATLKRGIAEFRGFRDGLIEAGVMVTTALGSPHCPDHVFPNWISTHADRQMVIYPMLNENRRAEKTPEIVGALKKSYDVALDMSEFEGSGEALEATGSMVLDRINKIVYAGLSKRTSEKLVRRWADAMGYEAIVFDTHSHTGQPVYHSDLVMFIGSQAAGICAPCLEDKDRARVLGRMRETHDVIEFSLDQLQTFCGNSLEVVGVGSERMLAMSKAAHGSLDQAQLEKLQHYFTRFVLADIPTLELYGGGSARCTIMELF